MRPSSVLTLVSSLLVISAFTLSAQTVEPKPTERQRGTQLIDPAAFGFGSPGFMVDATFMGTQDYANGTGGLDVFELRTILPVWTTKVGDTRIGLSMGYALTEMNFNGLAGLGEESLHTLEAQLAMFWRPQQSRWWGLGFITPGLGTDFQGVSWDDFEVSGLGLLGYKFTDSFSLAGGTFARYGADEGVILPALGFIWQPEPFIVQVTPPFIVLGWRTTDKLTLSLSAYPSGGSWDIEDPNVNRVDLSGWQTAASVIYNVTDNLTLSLRAGINVGGELELRDNANRVITNQELDSAPFGAINVRWNF